MSAKQCPVCGCRDLTSRTPLTFECGYSTGGSVHALGICLRAESVAREKTLQVAQLQRTLEERDQEIEKLRLEIKLCVAADEQARRIIEENRELERKLRDRQI